MTSSSDPVSYFESLPIELHRIILGLLPDFSSLRSIVIASRSAHEAYLLSPKSIQWNVLRKLLYNEPQLAAESRWLHAASYIRRNTPGWNDDMDSFLAYAGSEVERQHTKNPLETVTAERLRFHIVIEDITSAFMEATVHPNLSGATSQGTILNFPLRSAESIRIQRALYRFQRICQMYPRNAQHLQPGAQKSAEHPLGDFIRGLPSWELEELHCVYQYLIARLSFLDEPTYSALLRAQSIDKDFSSYRYKEQVVSMGLIFLRNLVTAPVETRLVLLKQYCRPETQPLSDILPLDCANNNIASQTKSRSLRTSLCSAPVRY